jgi:hypothetical protein
MTASDANNDQRAVEADLLLTCGPWRPSCLEADQLRVIGTELLRHYFTVAEMTEAAWARDVRGMLKSMREGRALYLTYLPRGVPADEALIAEFAALEARLVAQIEREQRAVS